MGLCVIGTSTCGLDHVFKIDHLTFVGHHQHELANPHVQTVLVQVKLERLDIGWLALAKKSVQGDSGSAKRSRLILTVPNID